MPKSFFQNNKKFFSVKKNNEKFNFKALCFKLIFSLFFHKSQMKIPKMDNYFCPFLKIFWSF